MPRRYAETMVCGVAQGNVQIGDGWVVAEANVIHLFYEAGGGSCCNSGIRLLLLSAYHAARAWQVVAD